MARAPALNASPYGLATVTSTLTTTRLDDLIEGGLARNAKQIVLYYATVILQRAHDNVPIKNGVLLRSLNRNDYGNFWVVENGGFRIRFGTLVRYAVFVEFGTRRAHAQPFLTPAVEYFREEWGRAISGIFWTQGMQVRGV